MIWASRSDGFFFWYTPILLHQDHATFCCLWLSHTFCRQLYVFFPNVLIAFLFSWWQRIPASQFSSFSILPSVLFFVHGHGSNLVILYPICTARAGSLWAIFPRIVLPMKSTRGWMRESISPALLWWQQLYVTITYGFAELWASMLCSSNSQGASSWLPDEWQKCLQALDKPTFYFSLISTDLWVLGTELCLPKIDMLKL